MVDKCNVPLLESDLRDSQGGGRRKAGGGAPAGGQLALVQLSDQLLRRGSALTTGGQSLVEELQCSAEVPHLYCSIGVACEDEPPRSSSHPTAALTFVHTETGDYRTINRPKYELL